MFDYFLLAPCVVFTIFIVIVIIGTQILYSGFIDDSILYYDTNFVYDVIKISLFEK